MKNIFNYFSQKDNPINPRYEKMSQEELLKIIYPLRKENIDKKDSLNGLTEINNDLKNSILNKKKMNSEIKNIYNTLFFFEEIDIVEKNKEFNDFLYDQYLLYDGLEEEEINDLNQIKIKEENWEDNKDLFIFKQKIIERNYQELFRNIISSNELQNLLGKQNKIIINDVGKNLDKNNENIENNKKEKEKEINLEKKDMKLNTLSDKTESDKKKEKHKKEKKKGNKINPIQTKLNNESLNPLDNFKNKEEKKINLDDLLDDEEDNELSFKKISDKNIGKGWEEEY